MTEDMEKEMRKLDKKQKQKEKIDKETDVVVDMEDELLNFSNEPENNVDNEQGEHYAADNMDEDMKSQMNEVAPNVSLSKRRGNRKKRILTILFVAILLIIISVFVCISLFNKFDFNVYKGVFLAGRELSGMSEEEVAAYVKSKQGETEKKTIKVQQGDEFLIEIDSSDFDLKIDEDKTVENIMKYGRGKNIFKNNIDVLKAMFKNQNIDIAYTYSEEKILGIIKEVREIVIGKTIDDSYTLNEKEYKLIINKGKPGNSIDEIVFKEDLIKSCTIENTNTLKIKTMSTEPKKLDVDVVYSNVVKDAKDAYIDKNGEIPKFVAHEVGLKFNKEELEKVINNMSYGKSAEFKLDVAQPKVKLSDITWNLYNYQVSTYKTYFSTADPNRVHNLGTALNILNGKVIMPGETFSYNAVVGSASAAQGFRAAATFVGGNVVKEVGGGICQTVSTLYNAALLANLEIVQRKNHSLPVGYVPGSRDATVYYPSVDFKFKNTRNYPLKIVTKFNAGGNLSVSLYGTKEEAEPVVTISSKTLSYIAYTIQYKQDSSLAKGVQVVERKGSQGYVSEAYKRVKINGTTTTVFLSKDTYKPVSKIVRIGTKAAVPVVSTPAAPVVETPVVETPVVETPVVETPGI